MLLLLPSGAGFANLIGSSWCSPPVSQLFTLRSRLAWQHPIWTSWDWGRIVCGLCLCKTAHYRTWFHHTQPQLVAECSIASTVYKAFCGNAEKREEPLHDPRDRSLELFLTWRAWETLWFCHIKIGMLVRVFKLVYNEILVSTDIGSMPKLANVVCTRCSTHISISWCSSSYCCESKNKLVFASKWK